MLCNHLRHSKSHRLKLHHIHIHTLYIMTHHIVTLLLQKILHLATCLLGLRDLLRVMGWQSASSKGPCVEMKAAGCLTRPTTQSELVKSEWS